MSTSRCLYLYLFLAMTTIVLSCQPQAVQREATLVDPLPTDKMRWWKEARFGMFIHWGLYAIPAGEYKGKKTDHVAEWIMHHLQIPVAEYEEFAKQFNPVKFDAEQWVSIAKDAGMKYIIITSKHHDGFCLWDSKVTEYDIMDASPFKRDILEELADECQKAGIRLGFYHSIMDWHHPQAQAIWEPNYNRSRNDSLTNPEFPKYFQQYLKPQVKELLTKYDDISVMWFDGEWVPSYTTEMGKELYQSVGDYDPTIIINNRVDKGRQGMSGFNAEGHFVGDFGTPEQEIPDRGIPDSDWESCMTMNDTWGFNKDDHHWKSAEELLHNLIDIASKGGNFLLNVGPTAEGEIPAPSVERLSKIGDWVSTHGESIYGTTASPFEKPSWGRFTKKGNRVYAHVFAYPDSGRLSLPSSDLFPVRKAAMLGDGQNERIDVNDTGHSQMLTLPEKYRDHTVPVIVFDLKS